MSKRCPFCKEEVVLPSGPKESKILIVGDEPKDADYSAGKPFLGPYGDVLREELIRREIDLSQCRKALLWIHKPNKQKECLELSLKVLLREAENREAILLLGAEPAKFFVHKSISEIDGLRVEEDIDLLQAPLIMCAVSPGMVLQKNGVVGDFRFAIEQFANELKKITGE